MPRYIYERQGEPPPHTPKQKWGCLKLINIHSGQPNHRLMMKNKGSTRSRRTASTWSSLFLRMACQEQYVICKRDTWSNRQDNIWGEFWALLARQRLNEICLNQQNSLFAWRGPDSTRIWGRGADATLADPNFISTWASWVKMEVVETNIEETGWTGKSPPTFKFSLKLCHWQPSRSKSGEWRKDIWSKDSDPNPSLIRETREAGW